MNSQLIGEGGGEAGERKSGRGGWLVQWREREWSGEERVYINVACAKNQSLSLFHLLFSISISLHFSCSFPVFSGFYCGMVRVSYIKLK